MANVTFVQAFQHGQTEVLKLNNVETRIRDLFRCEQPLVLLVHDAGAVRTLLGGLDIDTSDFSSELSSLLETESSGAFRGQSAYRDSRRRSRSPRRDQGLRDQRQRSPPRKQASVSLIDVRQMYITLRTRYTESNASLAAIATELGIRCNDKSMCAGNESRMLAEVWTAMASGPAIDEQFNARWGPHAVDIKSTVAAGSSSGDMDFDPNDLAPAGSIAVAQSSRARPSQMRDWDDLDDDEEEFYDR